MSRNKTFRKKLLVEGANDFHVISALCKKYEIVENFKIVDANGFETILSRIPSDLKEPDIEILGIVVDADSDIDKRWLQLSQLFARLGFQLPAHIPNTGLIFKSQDAISIGIWLMPDNQSSGMLEDFSKMLIPPEDLLLPEVNKYLEKIEMGKLNLYKPIHKSKAVVHTWLAAQETPGLPLGQSITRNYLSANSDVSSKFTSWLSDLFA